MVTQGGLAAEVVAVAARHAGLDRDEDLGGVSALAMVRALGAVAATALDLQAQAVQASQADGMSWARIGAELGVSRQAAQQRFGSRPVRAPGGGRRVLQGLSRSQEVAALNEAGREGWRLVGATAHELVLEASDEQWEVIRAPILSLRPLPSVGKGWEAGATRFPDCFFIRRSTGGRES